MRRMISLSLLFILCINSNSSVAKKLPYPAVDIQKVKKIEWIDPWGRKPTTYVEFMKSQAPPVPLKIQSLESMERGKPSCKRALSSLVLVILNSNLYPHIQSSITQYQDDLTAQGYSVETVLWSGGSPHDLRSYLQSKLSEELAGAVLIGDLPVAWFEHTPAEFPCDLYLMDLDGTWEDYDTDGILDTHSAGSGDVSPEIWIGRLDPSRLTWGAQAGLLQNYFNKNHDYRTGALSLPDRALAFVDDDWSSFESCDLFEAYTDVTTLNSANQTTAAEYKSRLLQNYEWIHVCSHSSCWAHTFRIDYLPLGGQSVFNYEIHALDPHAFFYNLFACSNTRFVEANCLGNWYIFGEEYGLTAVGSTKSGSMLYFGFFYQPLGLGKSIGESFKDWFCVMGDDGFESWEVNWFYGMNILGDPTLTINSPELSETPPYTEEPNLSCSQPGFASLQITTNEFSQGNPAITLDLAGKPWVVWEDGRHIRTNLYSSYFDGAEWSTPAAIEIYEYWDLHPAITTDSSGNIWAVWQSLRYQVGYNLNIFASYHNGTSWSSPEFVSTRFQYDLEPSVTTDRDGKVWVAWKSWRPYSYGVSAEIMASYFSGINWSSSIRVTSDTADNCDPAIVADQDGKVWIAWSSNRDGDWNIYSVYYDGTWLTPTAVTTHSADDLDATMAVDKSGKVWLAWQSYRDGDANVYASCNDGSGWSFPFQITSDPADDISPSFSQNSSGRMWISWMSKRCGNWDVLAAWCDGLTWSSPVQVTGDVANDYMPAVASEPDGESWVVWGSDRDVNWNVYSASSSLLPPCLIHPPDCSYMNDTTPYFEWGNLGSVDSARHFLQYSADSNFVSGVTTIPEIAEEFYQLPDTLALADDRYFWRVRTVVGSDSSNFCSPDEFTVDTQTPEVPLLLHPADDTAIANTTPTFQWDDVALWLTHRLSPTLTDLQASPVVYSLQYSPDSNFVIQVSDVDSLADTQYALPDSQPLDSCENYYFWRVRAQDLAGNESAFQANPFSFVVYSPGMVDSDCGIGLTDVVYLINYILKGGPAPDIILSGDLDCSGEAQIPDVVYLINYLLRGGPPPCKP